MIYKLSLRRGFVTIISADCSGIWDQRQNIEHILCVQLRNIDQIKCRDADIAFEYLLNMPQNQKHFNLVQNALKIEAPVYWSNIHVVSKPTTEFAEIKSIQGKEFLVYS